MDMTQSDSGEIRPTDPDLKWTGWALDRLREAVEIDSRTKRMTADQQSRGSAEPETPDYALMQSRLSRSIRLSIAMTERIRADYLARRDGREESGEQERRQKRREQAVDSAAAAMAQPGDVEDADTMRSMVRETLAEDEVLDAQIDMLSPQDFVRAVCRKIGRPPDPAWLPQGWDDGVEATAVEVSPAGIAGRRSAEAWPRPPDEPAAGRALPKPWTPDSS
ncbi:MULTISPECIES: hypothetical protein [Inquilinus]|uniref:Uncharacterized protein n=1 Tax=Inquilinus ginsengisoli TaxID=363840 RepID=A0ABU1JV04_9PROT|nr:hypothetical protein [Inquilinus ginsengisoli]MDR6292447.1 hypothetical protein [Inquilinus ginsengisoli]